ncbi:MAG: substrate-binding domain-containing protein [Spirochaetota bacterium]
MKRFFTVFILMLFLLSTGLVFAAGIPVVVPHSKITPEEVPGPIAWVTNDNVQFGIEAGQVLAEALGGKGTIAITQGGFNPQENPPAEALTKYIHDNYPGIKVLDPIEEGFDLAMAETRITSLLQANPDITAGFGTTGNSPVTWSNACNNLGRNDVLIIGMDYSRQNIDLVKNGKVYGIVAQPLFEIFQQCAVILDAKIHGKPFKYENLLPSPIVDKKRMKLEAREALSQIAFNMPSIKEKVENFSGGQKQAIAITRANIFSKNVLIMDEPTAALGVQESAKVLSLIKDFSVRKAVKAIIVISHNMEHVIDIANRVIVMRRGKRVGTVNIDDYKKENRMEILHGKLVALITGLEFA